jgi:hypothetical protein
LGPLLFLLYVNDLPLNVQATKMVLFADDINILVIDKVYKALQEKTNRVMEQLETRFLYKNLVINIEKTQVMLFRGKCPSSVFRPNLAFNKKRNNLYIKFEIPRNSHY